VVRLGLPQDLRRSLACTNIIGLMYQPPPTPAFQKPRLRQ
jgi:hypothetical protein